MIIFTSNAHGRDWLYAKNGHGSTIHHVLEVGHLDKTYNVGGVNEKTNFEIVYTVWALLDEQCSKTADSSDSTKFTIMADKPGHDRCNTIEACKIEREPNWKSAGRFEIGICKTAQWFRANPVRGSKKYHGVSA